MTRRYDPVERVWYDDATGFDERPEETSSTYPTPFTERPPISPTHQMQLDRYRDYILTVYCTEQRMTEVVKIQQALHDPNLNEAQRATLRRMWPIAYAAYTDPFGAKTYA